MENKVKIIVFFLFFFLLYPSSLLAQVWVNTFSPIQGDLLIVRVQKTDVLPVGSFANEPLVFRRVEESWLAFVGISYWLEPSSYSLKIKDQGEMQILVRSGEFPESRITISEEKEQLISPAPEDEAITKRRAEDRLLIQSAYSDTYEDILWEGPFIWPATGRITSGFGDTRYVNNVLTGKHSGIDIGAEEGTPIFASNRGRVRLASDLLVTGLTIILDHGFGIFSSYSHLSSLKVQKDDWVEKGEIIGLMGSTGFSTGSHLHWVIRTKEAFLNPLQFLSADILSMAGLYLPQKKILYLVQVGSFEEMKEAEEYRKRLDSLGYPGFIVGDAIYRVQIGAFMERLNARNLSLKLEEMGFISTIIEIEQ